MNTESIGGGSQGGINNVCLLKGSIRAILRNDFGNGIILLDMQDFLRSGATLLAWDIGDSLIKRCLETLCHIGQRVR
eukprot:117176-Amphidinium_carterae.1